MEFKDPRHIVPEKNLYRDKKQEIQDFITKELWGDKEQLQILAEGFFALMDVKNMKLTNLLTEEELEQFKLFATHGLRRLLHGDSQRGGKILNDISSNPHQGFQVLFHDLSHLVGSILAKRHKERGNSITPPFYRFKQHEHFNDREVIEDELYGFFWGLITIKGLPGNFTIHSLNEEKHLAYIGNRAPTFDRFKTLYIQRCMNLSRTTNSSSIEELAQTTPNREAFISENMKIAEGVFSDIIRNPPVKIVELLKRVWDEQDNPRILADIFFEEVGPYIEELQKRKKYTLDHGNSHARQDITRKAA